MSGDKVEPTVLRDPHKWVDKFIGHVVINLITSWSKEKQARYWAIRNKRPKPDPCTVTLSIDGFEADFRKFAEECERQLDRMVIEKAGEILKEQISDKLNGLMDAATEFERGLKEQAAKLLGYNPWENDR